MVTACYFVIVLSVLWRPQHKLLQSHRRLITSVRPTTVPDLVSCTSTLTNTKPGELLILTACSSGLWMLLCELITRSWSRARYQLPCSYCTQTVALSYFETKACLSSLIGINALRACVYVYVWQFSSFRAPMLWFIDMAVATCHIQYTFLSLCHFHMIQKWPPTVTRRAKH